MKFFRQDKKGNPPGILRSEIVDTLPVLLKNMIRRLVRWRVWPPDCVLSIFMKREIAYHLISTVLTLLVQLQFPCQWGKSSEFYLCLCNNCDAAKPCVSADPIKRYTESMELQFLVIGYLLKDANISLTLYNAQNINYVSENG